MGIFRGPVRVIQEFQRYIPPNIISFSCSEGRVSEVGIRHCSWHHFHVEAWSWAFPWCWTGPRGGGWKNPKHDVGSISVHGVPLILRDGFPIWGSLLSRLSTLNYGTHPSYRVLLSCPRPLTSSNKNWTHQSPFQFLYQISIFRSNTNQSRKEYIKCDLWNTFLVAMFSSRIITLF